MDPYSFTTSTLREAGALLRTLSGSFSIYAKDGDHRNILTSADTDVQDFIIGKIQKTFPEHAIHSEELVKSHEKKELVWTIDPIDGSSNFARNIPHYAICLGLLKNGVPEVGGVYNPVTNELFSFKKGEGAFCNDQRVVVSSITTLANATVFLTVGRKKEQLDWGADGYRKLLEVGRVRNFGSTALDVCFVGAGRIDACVYGTLTTLDIAPAIGFLIEAGGVVLTEAGLPAELIRGAQKVYAVNSPVLYRELRTVL